MIVEQTIKKLYELKLFGMATAFEEKRIRPDHKNLSSDEFFGLLVDAEHMHRKNAKLTRLLQSAKMKVSAACLEDIEHGATRGLDKNRLLNLQNTDWLDKHQNILITGPTGVGKTYLACAFGNWACRNGYSTIYARWPRLIGDMMAAKGDGSYLKYLAKLAKTNLLIIDDFGLNPVTDLERKDFLEIIEDRYMRGSTVITSQLPLKEWHGYIGEPTIADAVCDRLFHVAHNFELKGVSMRKKLSGN